MSTGALDSVSAVFYVTDLRHFEGIELDPLAPGPTLAFASYLRRIVRAATASSVPGAHPTALACRRRPQRRPCPGHLRVDRQEVPTSIHWGCPACGEGGRIDGWQGSHDDLSSTERHLADGPLCQLVLPEEAYRLLLEEQSYDHRCARMVYAATTSSDGVVLSGTEEELTALTEMAGDWAAVERSAPRRRRWRQVAQALEPRQPSWSEQRTKVMADELEALGLRVPRAQLAAMIQKALAEVARSLGISEPAARRYVDDERLRGLAQEAALLLAPEQPGADLVALPRTIPVSLELLGRSVSALAEATRVRLLNRDELGVQDALDLVSLFGHFLHERTGHQPGLVYLPQAAVARAGRLLESSAEVIIVDGAVGPELPPGTASDLAQAFLADAQTLRALVSEHGTSPWPTPDS